MPLDASSRPLSLSTAWAMGNFSSLAEFCHAASQMGFAGIELNHQVTREMLRDIEQTSVRIFSVHEPCPSLLSISELKKRDLLISSTDEDHRRQAVLAVKNSIDLARELGASMVVVHSGSIYADIGLEHELRTLIDAGRRSSDAYADLQAQLIRDRQKMAGPGFAAVVKSVRELLDYASRQGVRLGLENRDHYHEIPLLEELDELLTLAEPERLGMVYDVGHARALDLLGFTPSDAWLQRFGPRIFNAHLHDMDGLVDHLAPGLGQVDFAGVVASLPPDAIITLELHPRNSRQQVETGLAYLSHRL